MGRREGQNGHLLRAIHVARTRTTVTSDRLLEEVPHPWTRLQLILVISVRSKHPLLWRDEWARVHGMAVRFPQPGDVRAPVGWGECCRLKGLFLHELWDTGGYASTSLTRKPNSAIRWSGPPITTGVCANAVAKLPVVSVDAGVEGRPLIVSPPLMTRKGSASQSSSLTQRADTDELVAFDLEVFPPFGASFGSGSSNPRRNH